MEMDLFDCPICMNDMTDRNPRSLSCLHSFCTECLFKLIDKERSMIRCPTCRKMIKLESNDITELPVNFLLRQIKDRESKDKTTAMPSAGQHSNPFCQICKTQEPYFHCCDCPCIMCAQCKEKHEKLSSFKSHVVSDLCSVHQNGVSHLCTACVQPLCKQCMFMDHSQHEAHFVPFNEGQQELQQKAQMLQHDIRSKTQAGKSIENELLKILDTFKERKAQHEAKAKDTDRFIKEIETKINQFHNLQEEYTNVKTEAVVAVASLDSIITSTTEFCDKYKKLMKRAEESLENLKKVPLKELLPPYIPQEPCNCEIVKRRPAEPEEVQNLKLSKFVFQKEESRDIACAWQGAVLDGDVLFVNHNSHVIRLNQEGVIVDRYYPTRKGEVCGVYVHGNRIYITQKKSIIVIPSDKGERPIIYKPKVDLIDKIMVKDRNTIFIVNGRVAPNGKVYKYSVEQDKVDVILQGLDGPWYMDMLHSKDGNQYVLNEWGKQQINVYDKDWRLVNSFGGRGTTMGQFESPHDIAVTSMNTVLIADYDNRRISHHTADGRFLSNILTQKDGLLVHPVAIVYNKPYIWVAYGTVQCFKLE